MQQDSSYEEINISNKWLEGIHELIQQLQELELVCRDGGRDLIDYLGIARDRLAEVQFRNIRFMFTKTKILLTNTRPILDEVKFKLTRDLMYKMKDYIDTDTSAFIKSYENQATHKKVYQLTGYFYIVVDQLCSVREDIIQELSERGWIFPKSKKETKKKQR